jgi:hypothetical protein
MNQLFLFSGPSSDNFSDPPSANSIKCWYQQFQTKGCLCKGKSAGRPCVSEESVEQVKQSFLHSLEKSVRHATHELEMLTMTVWRVLQKRLEMKPYRLHLVSFCGDHHTRHADQSVARIRLTLDVCCVTKCAQIEHMWDMCYKLVELLFHFH